MTSRLEAFLVLGALFLLYHFFILQFNIRGKIHDIIFLNGDLPKVYVYEEPVFFPDLCKTRNGPEKRSYYFDVMGFWLSGLGSYSRRTKDPDDADVLLIPFNVDDSFHAGKCKGKTHFDRLLAVVEFLKGCKSFQKRYGEDHFWPILGFRMTFRNTSGYFPKGMHTFVHNMTLARYLDWHLHMDGMYYGIEDTARLKNMWRIIQPWRCTISSPIAMEQDILAPIDFKSWKNRDTLLYYRGRGRNSSSYPTWKNPNDVRNATEKLKGVIPSALVDCNHAENRSTYITEIQNSKFCLVIRSDDPQTSRFYDAISAGCIPVLISEGWSLTVAPFVSSVDYESFTITIPESMFWYDPIASARFIYSLSEGRLKRMLDALSHYRKMLLWSMSPADVVSAAFIQYKIDCPAYES